MRTKAETKAEPRAEPRAEQRPESGSWIPLMDYAIKKTISVSTVRRHIKAQKIIHKIEDGRYLLWDPDSISSPETHVLQVKVLRLSEDLQKAQEEIAELKTLIAFYEEQIPQNLPPR